MKVLCPACERMVELERFRLDGAALLVTCPRCGVETRAGGPDAPPEESTDGEAAPPPPAPAAGSRGGMLPPPARSLASSFDARYGVQRSTSSPRLSLVSEGASNVVALRTSATEAVQRAQQSATDPFAVPAGLCPKCLTARAEGPSCGQCGLVFEQASAALFDPPAWLAVAWRGLLDDWSNEALHAQARAQASQQGGLADLGRLYRLRLAWFPDDPFAETGRAEILRMATATVSLRPAGEAGGGAGGQPLKAALTVLLLLVVLGMTGYLLYLVLQGVEQ